MKNHGDDTNYKLTNKYTVVNYNELKIIKKDIDKL